jgi:CubicO group peptidase (beta-lactamase class C family)
VLQPVKAHAQLMLRSPNDPCGPLLFVKLVRLCACSAACFICILVGGPSPTYASPTFRSDGPNAIAYGAAVGYPVSNERGMHFMVGLHTHLDRLFPTRVVARGGSVSELNRADQDLSLTYAYDGAERTLNDYVDKNPITGLLIAKGNTILFEHYQYGRTDGDRFLSQSMTKTITAMLIGIAVAEGKMASIEDNASRYVPGLTGSEYGATSLRSLLTMSSGVQFIEDDGVADDLSTLRRDLFAPDSPGPIATVRKFNKRAVPADSLFKYASIETEVLGLVLRATVGMSLAEYLSNRVWQPLGAEADANWVLDATGQETAWCCVSATLRDYARLGLMLANDGAWNGRQIIPRNWVREATTIASDRPHLLPGKATPYFGYGYQVWLPPGPRRTFALTGIYGQAIVVDPKSSLVMVQTAVRPHNDPRGREGQALWEALLQKLGRE